MHARKNRDLSGQLVQLKINIIAKITAGRMVMIPETHTHKRHAQEQCLGAKICYAMQPNGGITKK